MSIKTDFFIKQITKKESESIIFKYHYLKNKKFKHKWAYGLFNKESELIGVAVYHDVSAPETVVGAFGLKRNEQKGIIELGRFALNPIYNNGNYSSFLLGNSLKAIKKTHKIRAIITYASSDIHVGYIYQATNFKYYGLTSQKKDFWVDGKIKERGKTKGVNGEWKLRPRKHRYAIVFDKNLKIKWKEEPYPKKNL